MIFWKWLFNGLGALAFLGFLAVVVFIAIGIFNSLMPLH